jgi:predicted ATPase
MRFQTLDPRRYPTSTSRDGVYLEANNWDDYGFKTLWTLHYVKSGQTTVIGTLKIGDLEENSRPHVPSSFTNLPDQFFSLGQDENYYDRLNSLGPHDRLDILRSLRDIALDLVLFRQVEHLEITRSSLMRSVTSVAVQTQFHRIAMGGVKLSPYSFSYSSPAVDRHGAATPSFRFDFDVLPQSNPRTNVHVLIGRNGVGKSFMLNDIAIALTRSDEAAGGIVEFKRALDERLANRFANVVSVAYSAFDAFEPRRQSNANDAMRHHYVGLKKIAASSEKSAGVKSHDALAQEFGVSLKKLVEMRRLERWRGTLEFLTSDPLFAESVDRMVNVDDPNNFRAEAREVFGGLSSGHKIVLLILTRLVETVEEATLVLIDEPESHLHPPLLSAFMTALSELLEDRNGVAIIATHSPVVVQEVPSNCVWKLLGSGGVLTAQRPIIETYGENVGTLTQEIFGLEVTASGFHRALAEAVQGGGTFEEILATFEGKLGAEARALLQSMVYFASR